MTYQPIVKLLNSAKNASTGDRIATVLIENFPKFLLGEIAKHRTFSLSAESSRAVPTSKVVEQVLDNPYIPDWTTNQKGMAGGVPTGSQIATLTYEWLRLRDQAVKSAKVMFDTGAHKQDVNRCLEPWMLGSVIITSTEWENFFRLRISDQAQPALNKVATEIKRLMDSASFNLLQEYEWYLPYPELTIKENVVRCASVSYSNHQKDFSDEVIERIYSKLLAERHEVPFEHVASVCCDIQKKYLGNFDGFYQLRKQLETKDTQF